MIIWKGFGFLVLLIAVAVHAVITSIFTAAGSTQDLAGAIGLLISGTAVWFVGKKFNAPEKARIFIDKQTGQEFVNKPDHSLFFIKMQYWAFVMSGFGVIMLVGILFNGKSPI